MVSLTSIPWCCCGCQHRISSPEPWTAETISGFTPVCGETPDPQTTGGAVAPCPLSRDVTVAALLCPGTSRTSEASSALLSYHSGSRKNQAPGSPTSVLDPKKPWSMQGCCSSLCWSLRTRLTLTMQAGTTGLLTVIQADGKLGGDLSLSEACS